MWLEGIGLVGCVVWGYRVGFLVVWLGVIGLVMCVCWGYTELSNWWFGWLVGYWLGGLDG